MASRAVRPVVFAIAPLFVVYLAAVALRPSIVDKQPTWLGWFGRPGSMLTVGIVVAVMVAVCVLVLQSEGSYRLVGASFTVVAALVTMTAVLGLSAYWKCHDANHPAVYTPVVATAQLITGSVGDFSLGGQTCPSPTPVALQVARIATLLAIFIGVGGVVVGVFRSQVDRLRANLAESVTVIVGIDGDTQPIISAVARTLDRRSTLVVITSAGDDRVQQARRQGARVVAVDFNRPSSLVSLRLWRHLSRLYLMSADPATNLSWLDLIGRRLAEVAHEQRLPLIVRIDDPWLAEAWRDRQFGGSNTRWAADVIGKYAVTAGRLLDSITAIKTIQRVFICGTSQLTLALCANLTRRALERDFYTAPGSTPLPALTLVESDAGECLRDHQLYRRQAGFMSDGAVIEAVTETPTGQTLERLIGDADPKTMAAILVDSHVSTTGARLAARFPDMPVYAWDPKARGTEDSLDIVGMLQPYGLALDTREGQVQDAWERAARLIHERYAATIDPQAPRSAAAMPWAELDEFYRGSNRRQVRNALWTVEQIAGHTWNTWGSPPVQLSGRVMAGSPPLKTTCPDELRPRLGDEHVEGRTRGLVSLLPPQRLEVRLPPRRRPQDPQQAGRLVGGRKRSGSAQLRGAQLGGHAVESAPARLSVTSAVAELHSGRNDRRGTTKHALDVEIRFGTYHAGRRRRLGRTGGRKDLVGARRDFPGHLRAGRRRAVAPKGTGAGPPRAPGRDDQHPGGPDDRGRR
jgi:hypothetical protein